MSNGLTLPFNQTVSTGGIVFELTNTFNAPIFGVAVAAIAGKCTGATAGAGVLGVATNSAGIGTMGRNDAGGNGVDGSSISGNGVYGISQTGPGVFGTSAQGEGVHGQTKGNVAAVAAFNLDPGLGQGVWAHSDHGEGVHAENKSNVAAVAAFNLDPGIGQGVWAHSDHGVGVHAESPVSHGVYGLNQAPSGIAPDRGAGVWGDSQYGVGVVGTSQFIGVIGQGNVLAARFVGTVEVTGDIMLPGADCAEQFDVAGLEKIDPGTVVVIGEDGHLQSSQCAYDKKVAGVISGAGNCSPGIILDKQSMENRLPVALVGKVYCKVDATYSPIEVGDLLTTSPTQGHAMKASDPFQAFGAVIGKALRPCMSGRGLIPILIGLH